ncbi:MAG: hypothetical protein ACRDV4_07625 [Acidimicrobiales bacterium]
MPILGLAAGLLLLTTVQVAGADPGTSTPSPLAVPSSRYSATPLTGTGYWLAGSLGGIGAYGGTTFYGSMAGTPLNAAIVGMAATPDGKGYWLVAADGGIFSFGDAKFYGSMGGTRLNEPVVGMTATPDGKGYWMVASDGGIFSFGDAKFYGSMGGTRLNRPVVAMAATPDGKGYWMAAADGGIFTFGDAKFLNSVPGILPGVRLNQPVVGMAATPDGKGYWLVAADGGIFTFGDAAFHGSTGSLHLNAPVVGMSPTSDGGGYWLVAQDGGVFTFGDALFRGSGSGYVPNGEWVTAMATGTGSASEVSESGDFSTAVAKIAGPPYGPGATGFDISWPQCGGAYPPAASVAVVGVNGGSAFTDNPCFGSEAQWGGPSLTVYLNLNSPQGSNSSQWGQGPAGSCALGDLNCESYNYGYNTAKNSVATAFSAGHGTRTWWLDVETGNYWTSDTSANDQVMAGALAAIGGAGYTAAIYSTNYQWGQIAGNYVPSVPVWYPTGIATSTPNDWCSTSSFAGGPVYLVQRAAGAYDGDYSC